MRLLFSKKINQKETGEEGEEEIKCNYEF